ncbi:MAG: DUF924 domain-containing protein [Bdellovibrionales bacterium]|nr:DUF924 domain-containing protein [Bdellovibrionales bacterium]
MQNWDVVYNFWFKEIDTSFWFKKSPAFDEEIRARFLDLHTKATLGELSIWRENPRGSLSEIILLDQFSRNMFRDSAMAFAFDSLALVLSQEAIRRGDASQLPPKERSFLYMPFMHSESLLIHEEAVNLFSEAGLEYNLEYEMKHKAIIEEFGRYPHRNKALGRESTSKEIDFLKTPGSSF